jgi:hypothetical protein
MASLINDEKIRSTLVNAEKAFENEDYKNSLKLTSAAFAYAKLEEERKLNLFDSFLRLHSLTFTDIREFEEIRRAFEEIAEEIAVLALGIDYRSYSRFNNVAPHARFVIGKEEPIIYETKEENYTRENALFCFNFVLECLLRWHT